MSPAYRRVPSFDALKAIHVALTFVLAGLGGILIAPGDTFISSSAWRLFVEVGVTEEHLGVCLFVLSTIGAVGIATTDKKIRQLSILTLAFIHFSLASAFFVGNPHGGAVIPYAALAGLGLYSVYREAGSRK